MVANDAHKKAMKKLMTFCVSTSNYGVHVFPNGVWKGKTNEDFLFNISVSLDSDYISTRKIISRYVVFLNKLLLTAKSKMQECITLSVTEAELIEFVRSEKN